MFHHPYSYAYCPTSLTSRGHIFAIYYSIGAGIGGLTAATALAKRGMRVSVYEQASHFVPRVGAGFGFSPNGQVCLKSLGIETRHLLHRFDSLVHLDRTGKVNGESDIFAQVFHRYGFTTGGCLRADLVATLQDALVRTTGDDDCVLYSHKLVSMEQDDRKVRLKFDGGLEQVEHDLVIGADGIHSKVAELMDIDPSPPVYSGANIYYGVIENTDNIDFVDKTIGQDHDVVQGNGTGQFITFRSGAPDKKVQIWANTYSSDSPPPLEEWGVGDMLSPDLKVMLDRFPSTHPIHELAPHTTPDRLLHFGLFYRKHKDVWFKGRTVLLGDSCHATLPYVGQGANQAIEDVIVLAECLSDTENHKDAFQSYFEQRSRRTRRIVKMANYMDTMHHAQNPMLVMLRDFLFKNLASGGIMMKAIEKEIVEECPVKDYAKYK